MTLRQRALALAAFILASLGTASAADAPYAKLANELGVPNLADSTGPSDKSQLQLRFVKTGETKDEWTKQLTVDIAKVDPNDTDGSTYAAIEQFQHELNVRHVHVDIFDVSPLKPYTAYYEFHVGTETDRGVAYSPSTGFVAFAQLAEKQTTTVTPDDIKTLKAVVGR